MQQHSERAKAVVLLASNCSDPAKYCQDVINDATGLVRRRLFEVAVKIRKSLKNTSTRKPFLSSSSFPSVNQDNISGYRNVVTNVGGPRRNALGVLVLASNKIEAKISFATI
jgi:hypothetical protein